MKRKYAISIILFGILIATLVYLYKVNNINNKPVEGVTVNKSVEAVTVNKPVEAVTVNKPVEAVTVNKPVEGATVNKPVEDTTVNNSIDKINYIIGEWEVKGLRCLPRVSITNKDEGKKSPIIGKKIIIDKSLTATFDNHSSKINKISSLSSKDMMELFNLTLSNALSFGNNVTYIDYGGIGTTGFILILQSDNTLVIKGVTEQYNTDGFYTLERVQN